MAEQKILPELSNLNTPYTLPVSDPFGLNTQMGAGVPGVPTIDTQNIDVKKLGKLGSQERLQNIRQQEADLRKQELQAKQQLAEGQQKIAEVKAAGQSAITTQEAERAKKIYQSVEDFREKNPAPELVPTKDNIQSLSTLFGLIGVIGMAMGGAGKQSATASLNAMSGMMKGWQQGRADLWKREVQEFDKNMLTWKAKLDDAIKKAEAAYKILPYNRAEAESKLNEILTSMGSNLLIQQNKVQGFEPTFKNLESLAKDAEFAIKESGVERRHQEDIAFQKEKFGAEQAYRKTQIDLEKEKMKEATEREEARERAKLIEGVLERNRGPQGQTPAQFNQMIMQAGGQDAIVVSKIIGKPVGPKDAQSFDGKVQYIHGLKTLADVAKDAKASGALQNVFASLNKFTFSDPDGIQSINENSFQQSVEENLKNAGISDTAIVQQKLALDAVFAGIRAKTGRNNAPLREFLVLSDVLKPGSVGREAYQTILANEAKVTREGLPWVSDQDFNKYYEFKYKKPSPFGSSDKSSGLAIGTVKQGYRYKGGDPSQESNWEKVKE